MPVFGRALDSHAPLSYTIICFVRAQVMRTRRLRDPVSVPVRANRPGEPYAHEYGCR